MNPPRSCLRFPACARGGVARAAPEIRHRGGGSRRGMARRGYSSRARARARGGRSCAVHSSWQHPSRQPRSWQTSPALGSHSRGSRPAGSASALPGLPVRPTVAGANDHVVCPTTDSVHARIQGFDGNPPSSLPRPAVASSPRESNCKSELAEFFFIFFCRHWV